MVSDGEAQKMAGISNTEMNIFWFHMEKTKRETKVSSKWYKLMFLSCVIAYDSLYNLRENRQHFWWFGRGDT